MSKITIKGKEYYYDADKIINFAEGLIGLPEMRRAVVIPMDEYQPFCWLVSLDNEKVRFIVIRPDEMFNGYDPVNQQDPAAANLEALTIVKISSDWEKTTVNLRAPIVIDRSTNSGAQLVLTESAYRFEESLPQI